MQAAVRFDSDIGATFSTYAESRIIYRMLGYLSDKTRTIDIPVHTVEALNRLNKARTSLKAKLGDNPSEKDLAEAMGLSPEELERLNQKNIAEPISLNTPIEGDSNLTIADTISDPDDSAQDAFREFEFSEIKSVIGRIFSKLKQREQRMLNLYFGLDGSDGLTHDKIAVIENANGYGTKEENA